MRLQVIGEKALHQPANPSLLAYSPSMELLAQGSTDDQVLIYRLNGQRVYGATLKGSKLQVNKIGWKSDGISPEPVSRLSLLTSSRPTSRHSLE